MILQNKSVIQIYATFYYDRLYNNINEKILMKKYHDRTYLILTSKRFSKFQRSKSNFKSLFTGYLQYINRFIFNVLKNVVQLTVWWLYYVVVLLQDFLKIIGVLKKNRVNRAFDFRFVYVFSLVGPCRNDCQAKAPARASRASKTSGTMSNQSHETFLNKYHQYLVCLSVQSHHGICASDCTSCRSESSLSEGFGVVVHKSLEIYLMIKVNLFQKLATSAEHVVYQNWFECQSKTKTPIFVYNMFYRYSELTIFMNNEQSVVILWVSRCKNKCFWQRFTCTNTYSEMKRFFPKSHIT